MIDEFKIVFLRGPKEELEDMIFIGDIEPELVVDLPEEMYSQIFNSLQEIFAKQK